MRISDSKSVAQIVQKYLREEPDAGQTIRVIPEAVEQHGTSDEAWWYVPVMVNAAPERIYRYYETLSSVEDKLDEMEHLNVLLVPGVPEERQAA